MERLGTKEKHSYKLKGERQKELLIALSQRRDRKWKKAKEAFMRPAFCGTELEAGRKVKNSE